MIYVIATIELEPNSRENYLEILKNNVVHVKAEAGCLQMNRLLTSILGCSFRKRSKIM